MLTCLGSVLINICVSSIDGELYGHPAQDSVQEGYDYGLCNSLSYLIRRSFYQGELNNYAKGCVVIQQRRKGTQDIIKMLLQFCTEDNSSPEGHLSISKTFVGCWNNASLVGIGQVSQKSLQYPGYLIPKNCPAPVFMVCVNLWWMTMEGEGECNIFFSCQLGRIWNHLGKNSRQVIGLASSLSVRDLPSQVN